MTAALWTPRCGLPAEAAPPEMHLSDTLAAPGLNDAVAPDDVADCASRTDGLLHLQAATLRLGRREFGPFELRVAAGERVAILGPSGAGKSTLLKLVSGELPARSGSVHFEGRPLAAIPRAALSSRRAVLPQSHGVAFGLPVALVVGLGRVAREPDPGQREIVRDALRMAQAGHLHDRRFDTLSGGEQARVQLARVLAQLWDTAHGLLLVDEPLSALDPGLQFELMDALQAFALARGHALVAVLHDINQALNGFDRLWLVSPDAPLQDLPTGLAALPALERLYGIRLRGLRDEQGGLAVLMQRRPGLGGLAPSQPLHSLTGSPS
ncbi:MAG TPA: ATP-binding cassette domain-containing protein [Ideonella sp.]|nr:ATP-binding cassette domain-containing protein [Ideonella sp.]